MGTYKNDAVKSVNQKLNFAGVAKIHGISFTYLQGQLLEGVVKKWALDPNTMGGFLSPTPYQVYLEIQSSKQRSTTVFSNLKK